MSVKNVELRSPNAFEGKGDFRIMLTGCWGLGNFGWIGLILNLILIVGLIIGSVLLAIWLIKRLGEGGRSPGDFFETSQGTKSPQEILQARYARGELTRQQYGEMMEDLGH
jgi:putative membrane protein